MRPMVGLALGALLAVAPVLARAAPTVAGLALPTRQAEAEQNAERLRRLTSALAQRLGAASAPAAEPAGELSAAVQRARELALDVKLDEAALLLDRALDRAAGALGDPADGNAFV